DPRVSLINIDVNKAVSNLKVVEEESNKLKEKEEKKSELETLYETSNERNLSSELHQGRRRSSSQSERKLSLKSAMNATEKALTYNSKYNRHRRNSSKIYQRKSTHKKAYSRSIGYIILKTSLIKKINEVASLSNQLKVAMKELASLESSIEQRALEIQCKEEESSDSYSSDSSSRPQSPESPFSPTNETMFNEVINVSSPTADYTITPGYGINKN
ncbi:hypothetical protein U3516DRAFT_502861, partial [Neocallimastix sp. 'constans']